MDGLSELELVAKAMDKPQQVEEEEKEDPLNGLDLSSLSVEDRAAIQPLIDALAASANGVDGDNLDELLEQLDAAEGVADDLEAKLDALLENMRGLEAEKAEEVNKKEAVVQDQDEQEKQVIAEQISQETKKEQASTTT